MVLLTQKEVAERIVARDGKESILSLSVKVYGDPKYIMKVGKRFFSPVPKVDSAIIAIKNISMKNFNITNITPPNLPLSGEAKMDEEKFFNIVKSGFAHKRKVLRKNLESLEKHKGQIDEIFKKLNINPTSRAENLPLDIWMKIKEELN